MCEADAARRFLLSVDVDVRWGDMDALAHVNNAAYFVYFEQARMAWTDSLEPSGVATGTGPILATTSATFLRPVTYPASLVVRLSFGAAGRSSIRHYYEVVDRHDLSIVYALGEAVVVWIDQASGKSVPLPDAVRAQAAPTAN